MKKWRSIADWGLIVLCVTTAFSIAAVVYVLMYLMPNGYVTDVEGPIIIFVLALFAISPAVLLLRERPLEGLDKWSPPGGASDAKAGAATADAKASGTTDSATKQPATHASKPA